MNKKVVISDLKNIFREPIILIMYMVPGLLLVVTKLFIHIGQPLLMTHLNFNFQDYYIYLMAMVLSLSSGMLGAATGFMMLDDRDAKIYELLEITPIGRKGYLINRMMIPLVLMFFYSLIAFLVVGYKISLMTALLLIFSSGLLMMTFAMILFFLSDDKVKGLTYAKGLNLILLGALVDLTENPLLINLSKIFPTYWLTVILENKSLLLTLIGVSLHGLWFLVLMVFFLKKQAS